MTCKDCDRPLTTYQGINQRPEDAEVFCEYCEANAPKAPTHTIEGITFDYKEMDPNEYTDFGTPEGKGLTCPANALKAQPVSERFYYVDHNKPWQPPVRQGVYLSLHTEDPSTRYDGNSEMVGIGSGTGYDRQRIKFGFAKDNPGMENLNRVAFEFKGDGPAISHFAIFDAPYGGTMIFSDRLDSRVMPEEGDTVEFVPGSVKVSLS